MYPGPPFAGTTAETPTEAHFKSTFVKLQRTGRWNTCIVMSWIWKYLVSRSGSLLWKTGRLSCWHNAVVLQLRWKWSLRFLIMDYALLTKCSLAVKQRLSMHGSLIKCREWMWGFSVSEWTGDFTFSSSETLGEDVLEGKGKRHRGKFQIKELFTLSYSLLHWACSDLQTGRNLTFFCLSCLQRKLISVEKVSSSTARPVSPDLPPSLLHT